MREHSAWHMYYSLALAGCETRQGPLRPPLQHRLKGSCGLRREALVGSPWLTVPSFLTTVISFPAK